MGGAGLSGGDDRFFLNTLPRLVSERIKNSDDGTVGG